MGWPGDGQLSHWLLLFGQNAAVGMVVVVVYATMRSAIEFRGRLGESALIGALFGLSAVISMAVPIPAADGMVVDTRSVFVMLGSLFGGPPGALIAAGLPILYRVYLGGPNIVLGIVSILAIAAIGLAINRRFGARIRDFGIGHFAIIGLVEAIVLVALSRVALWIFAGGTRTLSIGAALLAFPVATALIGSAMSLTHHRVWRHTQRRFTDIVETVSDLIWETDEQRRFTFASPRYEQVLGHKPDEMIGRTPEELGAEWQDEITAATHAAAFAARKPFNELNKVVATKDGRRRVLSNSGRPVFDTRGRFQGYRGTAIDVTEREKWRATVAAISGRVGSVVGQDFLKTLVLSVVEVLGARHAVIGIYENNGASFRTIARYTDGILSENQNNPITDMPSTDVLRGTPVLVRSNLVERYPRFAEITGIKAEACAATPLFGSRGTVLGMLLVAFPRPLDDENVEMVLQLFAGRVAAEIERIMIEEEWKTNRNRLLAAQQIGKIANIESDLLLGTSTWSSGMWDILGLDPAQTDANFETFMASVHPDDRAALRRMRERSAAGEGNEPSEFRVIRPDGEVRWLYRQSETMRDADGNVARVLVMLQDITDRRLLEAELVRSREHLLLAQRTAGIGSAEVDLRTGQEYWSDELMNIMGLDPGKIEFTFEQFVASVHPDDRDKLRQLRARNNAGVHTEPLEFRIVRPDGTMRWLRRQIRALHSDAGQLTGLVATHHDITDRKRMEEHIRESHDRLLRAQRLGKIGSTELNLQTGQSTWSDEEYRLLGLDPEIGGASSELFLSRVHPEDLAAVREVVEKNARGTRTVPIEFRVVRPDGEVRWIVRDVDIEYDAAGRPARFLTTKQDITDRKRMEERLRESHDRLVRAQRLGKIGSAEVNLRTGEVIWSEQQYRLFGLDPVKGGASFELFTSIVHPDDLAMIREVRERNSQGEVTPPLEFRSVMPDGSVRWMLREVEVQRDAAGAPVRFQTTQQDITDRKQMEEELRRSARHLGNAQRVGKMASVERDMVTGRVAWSAEAFHLFGIDPSAGQPERDQFLNLIHPDDRDRLMECYVREERGEQSEPIEYRLLYRNEQTRWFYRQAEFIRDAEGKPVRLIVAHQDVTEREEMRRLMANLSGNLGNPIGEDFLKALIVNMAQVVGAEYAYIGRLAPGDGAVRTQFLYLDGAFIENHDIPLWEASRTILEAAKTVRIDSGLFQHYPHAPKFLISDLEAYAGTPLLSAKGEVLGILAACSRAPWKAPDYVETVLNLSAPRASAEIERLASEREVENSRNRMAEVLAAVDIARDAVLMASDDFSITYINQAAINLFGLPGDANQIEGKRLRDFQGDEAFIAFSDNAVATMRAKGEWQGSGTWIRPADNKTIFFDARLHRLPKGGFVAVSNDATQRVRQEEEERRRQEWQAQASKLEALGNLAGGIAHDFNNLLGAILGFGQFLVEDLEGNSEQKHFAERIVAVSQRGRSLVQQILTFARRGPVEAIDVKLAEVISETHELLRATLPATTALSVENHAPKAIVLGDKGQLSQVFVNLCVNGSDALAGQPGKIDVRVAAVDRERPELWRLAAPQPGSPLAGVETWSEVDGTVWIVTGAMPVGAAVSVAVADNGSGIPTSVGAQIFEPFFTTKGRGRGTGLGLAVVHRIVLEHGGAILVKTKPDAGTSFEVLLPLVLGPSERDRQTASPDATGRDREKASILVVDDDESFCAMVETALRRLGYRVQSTNDPRLAQSWLTQGAGAWDVLVTDQNMPHIHGEELVRFFKAHSPHTRCLICTGYTSGISEQRAHAVGADGLLMKPFDPERLATLVGRLLQSESTPTG